MSTLVAMDENTSGVFASVRDVYSRETLSRFEMDPRALDAWKQSLHNGFEIWWLAGMPIMLVFLLTLLSLSMVAGIPRHIAVIMDGNRRYGKSKYGAGVRGHSDGSKTLVAFTDWCIEAGIQALTVFAFSTENWNRDPAEVDALMGLFRDFMHQIVPEALKRNIRVRVLVSDGRKFPSFIVKAIEDIESKTKHCDGFDLNICVSYGARDEIAYACRKIATKVANGEAVPEDIDEQFVGDHLLTAGLSDPDVLVRTSGELRISNFLLFQIAYSELIFLDKNWPEVTREDLHEHIILEFNRRKRRFGK
ncbi:hypothetical protein P43SY_007972 [Pythium insidiosum]|uniref:Alkyl transferase n=1 Tax=Pythium insidiosum TaxID=114742 RepID=A0AAD5LLF3_PYTIN|nr:hypothetical protein P43SY_007972 [Pythium insidiosum]